MTPAASSICFAFLCFVVLLCPDCPGIGIFVSASKGKPKKGKSKFKGRKGSNQCLAPPYLTARASAIKKEIGGQYISCGTEAYFSLYPVDDFFYHYPFSSSEEPEIITITPVDSAPHDQLALFDIVNDFSVGPIYNNSVVTNKWLGKWDFIKDHLIQIPADNNGENYGKGGARVCERFDELGYPDGTLYCCSTSLWNDVDDFAKSEFCDEFEASQSVSNTEQLYYCLLPLQTSTPAMRR